MSCKQFLLLVQWPSKLNEHYDFFKQKFITINYVLTLKRASVKQACKVTKNNNVF